MPNIDGVGESVAPVPGDRGMAGRIHVLPEAVANKIAAGEVVERPASVVKELVENALDAGARRIVVELEEGGAGLICVSDDGEGMTAADAALAFTRHATSKIRDQDDLVRISTLGFRGEALPSIAAVASVELTTRARGAESGVRVRVEGGRIVDARAAGTAEGTVVAVRALFAPVPARRKFLKSVATEIGHVLELMVRQAFASPHVHFRVMHQGRDLAVYPPVATIEERARQVFGRDRARGGRAFAEERLGIAVAGYVLSPHLSFASGRYIHTFVNGRSVRDRGLTHAIVEGYASLVPRGRWPGAVVMVTMPASDVDVNVHPAKHEVRFRLPHVVHDVVLGAVRRALSSGATPQVAGGVDGVAEALRAYASRRQEERAGPTLGGDDPRFAVGDAGGSREGIPGYLLAAGSTPPRSAEGEVLPTLAAQKFRALKFVGQVFRGYLLCEGAERLVLIDQHAAHERIAFERLRAQLQTGAIERQSLLIPVSVDVDPRQLEALTSAEGELASLGFEVEPFGERTVLVREVPALLGDDDPALLVTDLADGLAELGSHRSAADALENVLGRIACHSVVRVGRALAASEIERLLGDLDNLTYGSNCPHGRPVSVEFTRGQVERMFGR